MPRLTREQNRQVDQLQRQVITLKPQTVTGGFLPAALIPILAAAAAPLAAKAGSWVGRKIFGNGIRQSGRGMKSPITPNKGAGLLRSGDRMTIKGKGNSTFRAGDYKMASMMPLPHYKTGTQAGMNGGFIASLPDSIVPAKVKSAIKMISTVGGKKKKASRKSNC